MLSQYLPRRAWHRICLLGLCLLAACGPMLDSRQGIEPPQGTFSATGTEALPDRWWQSFDDPALDRLVEQALTGNLTLQRTWDRLDQARAIARKAGAEAWPQVNADAGFTRARSETGDRKEIDNIYNLGLAVSYEVDLWGRIGSSREAARLDAIASAENLQTAALTLTAQVATTWFQLLEQNEQVELLEQQLATNLKTLELISVQFRTGQVGIADLLQQRQVVESRRGELSLAQARRQVLKHQLAVLLGLPPDRAPALAVDRLGELPPLPVTGLQSDLLERRPDIQAAWLTLQAADQRVATAVADRFPRLSLTGRASTVDEDISGLFDDWLASLAANLVAPVIDGGRRRAEVDRTRAVAAEALHAYGQTVLEALAEVEDALVREQKQREYLDSLNRQLELAVQATGRIRDRYINGAEDYQRVLISILSEQQLQRSTLTARTELFANRVKLCRALAGGWDISRPTP